MTGGESWEVRRGSSMPVDVALYVRDTLALSVDVRPFVPGLAPGVPVVVPAGVDRRAVAEEWPGWWADILEWCRGKGQGDPKERERTLPVTDTSPALAHRPALRVALAALNEPAARYRAAVRGPAIHPTMIINEVVSELARELGRPVKPFQFTITEVRVDQPMWEPLTTNHVLASRRFVDAEAARPMLRAAFLPLA